MTTAPSSEPELGRTYVCLATTAGIIGPVLFVTVFTVEGWSRSDYHPRSMFVSELSLGPDGWVQIVNFVISGALLVVFGRALAPSLRSRPAGGAGPLLLQIIGLSLMASGPFVTDPSALFDQHSIHGVIHGVFGAVVFSLAPVTCFVFYRRFRRDPAWRGFAAWTLAVGVVLVLGLGLLKVAQQPGSALFAWKGLVQRVVLVGFMGWVFTVAALLPRSVRPRCDTRGVHRAPGPVPASAWNFRIRCALVGAAAAGGDRGRACRNRRAWLCPPGG